MAERRNEEEAGQGWKSGHLRWMLIIGTGAAIVAMLVVALGFSG